jgi:hypothetical protein
MEIGLIITALVIIVASIWPHDGIVKTKADKRPEPPIK